MSARPTRLGATPPVEAEFHPDVVVLGGGLMGSVVALELVRQAPHARVLVLEAGSVTMLDHGQSTLAGPELCDELLVRYWDTTTEFAPRGGVETLGGSSVVWSGWCPRPRASELVAWPAAVVEALDEQLLGEAEEWLGVSVAHSAGELAADMAAVVAGAVDRAGLGSMISPSQVAPIALTPAGHVFSPLPRLREAARQHRGRLRVATGRRVMSLETRDGRVDAVITNRGRISVADGASVVLALGTVESARQVMLTSPPLGHRGSPIAVHAASAVVVRLPVDEPRPVFGWAALLLPGRAGGTHFHVQVHAAVGPVPADRTGFLRKEIPGLFGEELLGGTDDKHMVVSLVGIGELAGADADGRLSLVEYHRDPFEFPRASLSVDPDVVRAQVLDVVDDILEALCRQLQRPGVRYRSATDSPDAWRDVLPARRSGAGGRRWTYGVDESGSLPMSDVPRVGATDTEGLVHGLTNLYATGLSLFPCAGSHHGGLTATALALRLARRLAGVR